MDQQEVALLDQAVGPGVVVDAEVVHRDDLARTQAGGQDLLDEGAEDRAAAGALHAQCGLGACLREGAERSIDAVAYHATGIRARDLPITLDKLLL